MPRLSGKIFDSIESAHGFVTLLAETVVEAKAEIDCDVEQELDSKSPRRLQAFRVISYNLQKLALHMRHSCRILNDLRSLRRLLLEERARPAAPKPKPAPQEIAVPAKNEPLPPPLMSPGVAVARIRSTTPVPGSIAGRDHPVAA